MSIVSTVRRRPALVSLFIAIGLTVVALPEVVFLGGSLSPTGLNEVVTARRYDDVRVYPDPEGRTTRTGTIDIGARVWQLDPATKFMHRAIYDGESTDWNPYSAAGSLGPETLADLKFSPLVVFTALLGATSDAFTFVMLVFIIVALYCLLQLFTRSLGMHRLAGVAACVMFLIGGWASAMLTSQMSAPYVLFPVVLYTLVEFLRNVKPWRLLFAVGAYVGLLLTTFLPVVLLMLIFVHAMALVIDAGQRVEVDESRSFVSRWAVLLGRQAIVPVIAMGATAFLFLPVRDAYRLATDELARYDRRQLESRTPIEFLSLLTPRHVIRSYLQWNLATEQRQFQQTIYIGIAPLLLIAGALPRARRLPRRVLIVAVIVLVIAIGQHMGAPVLSVVAALPGLKTVSATYWAALVAAAAVVATGVAIDTAARNGLSWKWSGALAAVFLVGLAVATVDHWRPSANALLGIALAGLVIVAVVALTWYFRDKPTGWNVLAVLALALVAAELFSYQSHVHVKRVDVEDDLPPYIEFVQDHVGNQRVLAAGRDTLYPEWGAALGIRQVGTLNAIQIPQYRTFFHRWVNPAEKSSFLQIGGDREIDFEADPTALDQLSVRYLIVSPEMQNYAKGVEAEHRLVFEDDETGVRVYENPDAFPRVYLSPALDHGRAGRSKETRWDMARTLTIDDELLAAARRQGIGREPSGGSAGHATIVADHNSRVQVEVDATQPAVLVLTDSFHDNWHVTVNGEPAHLGLVNDVVRGVVVPEGHSVVEFHYESTPRKIGTVISVATVIGLLVGTTAWAVVRRRRRAEPPVPDEVGQEQPAPVG